MYDIEDKYITQPRNENDSQLIILWTLLGAIQEAILKLHLNAKRDYYCEFINKHKGFENLKVKNILDLLVKDNSIRNEDYIILEKINGNRNLIHFLNNDHIYPYDIYCQYVDALYKVLLSLYKQEKEYKKDN